MRGVLFYAYGGVLTVSDVVLRLPERSLEIMRKVKVLSGELGTVGKRRVGGTFLREWLFMCTAGSSRFQMLFCDYQNVVLRS